MSEKGIQPNVISYSAAISACEKGGQWQEALKLFREMSEKGIQPNVISYSAAISACEKGGQWQEALKLFREMSEEGIQPNVISYNAAISACEKGRQWEKALELLRKMSDNGVDPDVISYSAAIHACFVCEKYPEAYGLIEPAQATSVLPKFYLTGSIWDLHNFSLPVSSLLIANSLIVVALSADNWGDIVVVTGQGHGSGPDGPVLKDGVPTFLTKLGGPVCTSVVNNPGCFQIKKSSLVKWKNSSNFDAFQREFLPRQENL